MKNNGNLIRTLAKSKRFSGREWCGCFTPSEILALVEDGAKPSPASEQKVQSAKDYIKDGKSCTNWFYFYLGKTRPSDINESGKKSQNRK